MVIFLFNTIFYYYFFQFLILSILFPFVRLILFSFSYILKLVLLVVAVLLLLPWKHGKIGRSFIQTTLFKILGWTTENKIQESD